MSATEEAATLKILFQHQYGFLTSKIMFTASEFGIFDLLMESGEFLTSATIAERLGTSAIGMERLLEACVGLKFLQVERKDNQTLYGNTDFANLYLAKSGSKSQYHYMKINSVFGYQSMQYLADAVREGKNQNDRIHGISSNCDFYETIYRSESGLQRPFMDAMNATWSLFGRDVMTAFDLSHFPFVCDVGVTILDLPEIVETAKNHYVSSEDHRITFHEADFFKDPIPEADLYILARILHCWGDEKCVQLLTKLHNACKPGGGVLVVETVLNEDRSGPLEAQLFAMQLLLHTEGKERSPSEYNVLLSAAGFKEIQLKKRIRYDAILGRK
ncbi:acetylserotonin O-methyltransferase-like isoform X2 [Rhineura floridana]|uniref:acetylserotonin O-methyltransferase-like isoform X2 n=1 Tax=Rhineura floridana TaxID=261503 RepID=UPI002AC87E68|nr:acetylserotonin O-methyltransferase-like isoform X2 [Rhineura floridana]